MPRSVWTVHISGVGENRNTQPGDVDALVGKLITDLREAGHEAIGHRISYDTREVETAETLAAAALAGNRPPGSGSVQDARRPLATAPARPSEPYVLERGGTLITAEGVSNTIIPGSSVVATGQSPDGHAMVSIARNGVHVGTGTVRLPDGQMLTHHGGAWTGMPAPTPPRKPTR